MPDRTFPRGLLRELDEIDGALRAALGAKYFGATLREDDVTLHFADDMTPAEIEQARSLALTEIAKIDPLQPAPSVLRKQRVTTATDALKAVDFADVKMEIEAISNLAEAKAMLLKMARFVWRLTVIMSLNEQDEE